MKEHTFQPKQDNPNYCWQCGMSFNNGQHAEADEKQFIAEVTGRPVTLNPSDEKLREMIAEKDREIGNLEGKNKQLAKAYIDGLEMDAQIIAKKDAEIARLKKDAERYRKLKAIAEILEDTRTGKAIRHLQIVVLYVEEESVDEIVDSLPEQS